MTPYVIVFIFGLILLATSVMGLILSNDLSIIITSATSGGTWTAATSTMPIDTQGTKIPPKDGWDGWDANSMAGIRVFMIIMVCIAAAMVLFGAYGLYTELQIGSQVLAGETDSV